MRHHWHQNLTTQLALRDAKERTAFQDIYQDYNSLLHKTSHLTEEKSQLENELRVLGSRLEDALKSAAAAKQFGSPEAQRKFVDLEKQLGKLKDERTDLFKTQAENAQRLLELMETVKKQEEIIKSSSEEKQKLTTSVNSLNVRVSDFQDLVREKDGVIQILKDELAIVKLELDQREEQLKQKEARVKQLETENKHLVDRWMLAKQEEARKMNEANEFVETALKTKQATLSPQMRLFSSVFGGQRSTSKESLASPESPMEEKRRKSKSNIMSMLPSTALKKMAKLLGLTGNRKTAHEGEIHCIQISKDGSLFATGSYDKKILVFDAKTGGMKSSLTGATQAIMSIDFNNTNDLVLGTSNDHATKIWTLTTNRLKHTLTGHIGKIYSAKFTDSNRVITGSHDRSIKLWDLTKGYCMKTIFTISSCNGVNLLDGEGTVIVSGHLDNNIRLWDTRTGNLIHEITGVHSGQITSVESSSDYTTILTTSRDNNLKMIDMRSYGVVNSFSHPNFRVGMNWAKSCFSPDSAYVASGSVDGTLYFWNTVSGLMEKSLTEHRGPICGVVWNPLGGSAVYSADKDQNIVVWGS
ncbi:hypothetical protein HK102_003032 [Quaeritorhiza haematococci]|nr:hypothetical protein HK102_003032 [Quaeritorhiza haematococci]